MKQFKYHTNCVNSDAKSKMIDEILEFEGEIFHKIDGQWFYAYTEKPVSSQDIQEMKNLNEDYSLGMIKTMDRLANEMESGEVEPLLVIYPPLQIRS